MRTTPIIGGDFNAHLSSVPGDEAIGRCGADLRDTPDGEALRNWANSWEGLVPTTHLAGRASVGRGSGQMGPPEAELIFGSFLEDVKPSSKNRSDEH